MLMKCLEKLKAVCKLHFFLIISKSNRQLFLRIYHWCYNFFPPKLLGGSFKKHSEIAKEILEPTNKGEYKC
jgi:hypothetical protein